MKKFKFEPELNFGDKFYVLLNNKVYEIVVININIIMDNSNDFHYSYIGIIGDQDFKFTKKDNDWYIKLNIKCYKTKEELLKTL
jgi:hypothetical protein